ncbi:hypothetical protein K7432_003368 [Basidiobolus ranarum]|uniref:Uncharacterized protein n=1 Tax=Basidiobolus ranarum TaxID=34480 RepID=A0ABR2X019_9FUNG
MPIIVRMIDIKQRSKPSFVPLKNQEYMLTLLKKNVNLSKNLLVLGIQRFYLPIMAGGRLLTRFNFLGILLWSLHLYPEIPQYNHYFPRFKLFQSTGIMPAHPQSITEFLRYMSMEGKSRSPPAVQREINIAEAWYWRSRAQALLAIRPIIFPDHSCSSSPPPKIPKQLKDMIQQMPEAIAQASVRAQESQLISKVKDNDFGVDLGGIEEEGTGIVAYKDLPSEQHEQMKMLAEYRMLAFGWLTGRADWDADTNELGYINPISAIWAPSNN